MNDEFYELVLLGLPDKVDFSIFLKRDLAVRLVTTPVSGPSLKVLTTIAGSEVSKTIPCHDPYIFYHDTSFVTKIGFDKPEKWLELAPGTLADILVNGNRGNELQYRAVGDFSLQEATSMIYLFGRWIEDCRFVGIRNLS